MTKEDLLNIIPEINLLEDESLKEKCVACWLEALELGGWEQKGIRNCSLGVGYVTDDCPEKSIDHCRRVIRMCKSAFTEMGNWANEIGSLDENTLLAGAILHDIGKFLEYDYRDGKPCYSPNGHLFRHIISGAYLAQKHGLPEKVVHMVLAHSTQQSPEGANVYMTPELLVLKYMDHLVFSFAQMHYPVSGS